MKTRFDDDTIIAVSTPIGYGGLGIVRLSGDKALSIARKIWRPKAKRKGPALPHCLVLGEVFDRVQKTTIDEAYLAYFPKPDSYTREDVIEMTCHGSPVILEEVVRLGIRAGARHAHPGEFTLRAYLRGRIDILQAEAVNDLITATSLHQAAISLGQLKGGLSQRIGNLRGLIVHLLSNVEAMIEFPEEGLPVSAEEVVASLKAVILSIKDLSNSYESGRALREGLNLAIVGRANVGKSTLFNALLEEDRAIVSPYPGTTRDYLRERLKIKDSIFHLIDMAGLERPSHPVEKEGIRKGEEMASRADGILLLLDASRPESAADKKLIEKFRDKKAILLFNKVDLPAAINKRKCLVWSKDRPWLEVSALRGKNLDLLRKMIHRHFSAPKSKGEEMILHLRQKLLLDEIKAVLDSALELVEQGHSEEVYVEEIRRALPLIGKLTGDIRAEEVIEEIFSRFCVGK